MRVLIERENTYVHQYEYVFQSPDEVKMFFFYLLEYLQSIIVENFQ